MDPAAGAATSEWVEFLEWVDAKIGESGVFNRRRVWIIARDKYLNAKHRTTGLLQFGTFLVKSGYAYQLTCEKFVGYSLPEHLAQEWMLRSKMAS